MLPVKRDIDAYRGDDFSQQVLVVSGGVPVDITGWSFTADLRRSPDDIQVDTFAITIDDAANGLFSFSLTEMQTATLVGLYAYDVQSDDGTGFIRTLVGGKFNVSKDVTRA